MIVWHAGEIGKGNFQDKASVYHGAGQWTQRGEIVCPCGGELMIHGCYRRHFRDEYGKRHYGWVAQGHCAGCGRYHALIPDFLMPYKHYETSVVEAAIQGSEGRGSSEPGRCQTEESTVRGWVRQFRARGVRAAGWLTSILLDVYDRHISAVETRNRGLLDQLRRLAREFPGPSADSVMSRVNIILTSHGRGFL